MGILTAHSEPLLEVKRRFPNTQGMIDYFKKTSIVARMLMKDPGTFEMLEIVYAKRYVRGEVDEYLLNSLSAQALRHRFRAVVSYLNKQIAEMVKDGENILIVNLGSGSARDTIEVIDKNRQFLGSVLIDCVDTNPEALLVAENLTRRKMIARSFEFTPQSLAKLSYQRDVDLGLLVGVLCGLEHRACVIVLRRIKKYLKKGGILMASNVLESQLEQDLEFCDVLKDIIGWKLVYKTTEELRDIFQEAGYVWKGVFYDEPTNFHAMGIGMVPFT